MQNFTKLCLLFALFSCLIFCCYGNPIEGNFEDFEDNPVVHTRFRRATCDLLSFSTKFGSLNHAACAAHCLTKGFKGGYCNNKGVCNCRR